MLAKTVSDFLKTREFVSTATCNLSGRPNAAPKFILKIEGNHIYLVDYAFGRSYENIKINPKVSLSFVDTENLKGYQVNGSVELVEKGPDHEKIALELTQRVISLSTDRIIKGVSTGRHHENFEVAIPKKFAIFKVKIEEVVELLYHGGLNREEV